MRAIDFRLARLLAGHEQRAERVAQVVEQRGDLRVVGHGGERHAQAGGDDQRVEAHADDESGAADDSARLGRA